MSLPKERETDVGVSGFQDIKKIRGLIVDISEEDQPETWEGEGRVVRVSIEDTVVLETFSGDDAIELKEGKFNFMYPYKLTDAGKIVSGTPYHKCWLGSAKEMGKIPSQFIGEYVTLEKQPRVLFPTFVPEGELKSNVQVINGEDGQPIKKEIRSKKRGNYTGISVNILAVGESGLPKYFCFVAEETAGSDDVNDYIRNLVVGLNQKAALRKLLIDVKSKQHPEYKIALNDGTLADMLELVIVDDKFEKLKDVENANSPS